MAELARNVVDGLERTERIVRLFDGRQVGDRAVAVVVEVVFAIVRIAAHVEHVERLRRPPRMRRTGGIPLDPAVCEIDAEEAFLAAHDIIEGSSGIPVLLTGGRFDARYLNEGLGDFVVRSKECRLFLSANENRTSRSLAGARQADTDVSGL